LALARFMGCYSEDQAAIAQSRREEERRSRDAEWEKRKQAEQTKRDDAERLIHDSYHGFLDGMTPLKIGKVRAALETSIQMDGVLYTRKTLIEKLVAEGRKVEIHPSAGRVLIDRSQGRFHYQKDLTKIALDYAAFLSA
jgi:hypothetical protein